MRKILDVHAHIYPDSIAAKAAKAIGDFYSSPMEMNGTISQLLQAEREAGIAKCVIHSAAVTPEKVHRINDFLIRTAMEHSVETIGFGTLHPEDPDTQKELLRLKQAGMKGIKLHPDFQHFFLDDEKALEMFRAIADSGLPALIHIGDPVHPYSAPARMAKALDAVPNLRVICAHLGGWSCWTEGWKQLAGRENVWVDTSSSLYMLSPQEAVEIIRKYGTEHVFFGTDYPMWKPAGELERFMKLPLTEEEREHILYHNLASFLDIEG